MVATVDHLIGGEWVASESGARFESRDPHDDALLATVAAGEAPRGCPS